MVKKTPNKKMSVETLTHVEASRRNIPTAEYQSLMPKEQERPIQIAYERRNRDLDPQLVWRGKDEQDWSDLVVHVPPLYIQEKVHPKVLIDDLLKRSRDDARAADAQIDLFADFNGLPSEIARTEFYQHDANWSNRMILGDSLQVMASLAEREGLRGKVQCIYMDPPYGIKFNSNFQWSTTSRDVKDGNVEHITREPEQVKAFRDTWRDGIHSYLTYLRDRLTVARDLLSDSGSIFVQIGDENVHRVRALMDEVFGEDGFVSQIYFVTTTSQTSKYLPSVGDLVLWYSRFRAALKYRSLLALKDWEAQSSSAFALFENDFTVGSQRTNRGDERLLVYDNLTSRSGGESTTKPFFQFGRAFTPTTGGWKTSINGLSRLNCAGRIGLRGNGVFYVRYFDDFPYVPVNNLWRDTQPGGIGKETKQYVVQTSTKVIQRCILMTTDPGDLVLDPTCGSGTTAYVAEQWGRRWITIDTSRVALALARARIMGARYPYYLLADSPRGQQKEAELSGKWSVDSDEKQRTTSHHTQATNHYSLRQGFVYERVPHITLKSIANNAEIDVIWEKYQQELEPLRHKINDTLGVQWEEWQIPRESDGAWPDTAKQLHTQWWEHRIARQKEMDASIAANADFEYLYDKPYEDKKVVRVAGPFTVESLAPHRVLAMDENDNLIDTAAESQTGKRGEWDFAQTILENLRTAGVQQAHKEDKIAFTSLNPWPGRFISGEGRYLEGRDVHGVEKRAGIFIGPEFGTVSRPDLVAAAREAGDANFDVLIACAFNYDAHSSEFNNLGRIPVLKARMNADLHMADDLKNTGKGNLFVIFGEPDIEVISGLWVVAGNGRMVAHYNSVYELSGLGCLEEINRVGRENLSHFKKLSTRREVRTHEPGAEGSSVGISKHRGGCGEDGNGRISPESERSQWVASGSGNVADSGRSSATGVGIGSPETLGHGGGDQQNARWTQAIAAIEALRPSDFPLALTTGHYTQVTLHGVDVFHPTTGEVRSDGADGIACWFIDTDYDEEGFFVRQAYFLGANDPYKSLKTTLKAEINQEAWNTLNSDTSRPFPKPKNGRIAVKVINHLGDEVMKVFKVD